MKNKSVNEWVLGQVCAIASVSGHENEMNQNNYQLTLFRRKMHSLQHTWQQSSSAVVRAVSKHNLPNLAASATSVKVSTAFTNLFKLFLTFGGTIGKSTS